LSGERPAEEGTVRIELGLLLPDVPDERDACVARMQSALTSRRGILDAHVVPAAEAGEASAMLCVHYDLRHLSLEETRRLVETAGVTLTNRYGHTVLPIRAVDSEDAAGRIEAVLLSLKGVIEASVSIPAQRVRVEFDRGSVDETDVVLELESMGYRLESVPRAPEPGAARGLIGRILLNPELTLSLSAGLILALTWSGERWLGWSLAISVPLYAASYIVGGWDLVSHWFRALRKGRLSFDIDLLMLLAAGGAAILGEWAEGAFLLFLFSLAHALEHMALDRARGAIRALSDLAPATARVLRDGDVVRVPVEAVVPGDWVIVRPAERIPVDGQVREGSSAVNQAPITGESVPVEKAPGDEVYAGTVNGDGTIQVETTHAAGDRTLDRVIRIVEEAQTRKAPTERFTDRFEKIFVPTVLVAAVLLAILPPAVGAWDWSTAFYRSLALLVAASPCALALGTPSAVLAGIAQAARNGVLVKGGLYLEALGAVKALALDKTGTLTLGVPEVTDVSPAAGVSAAEVLTVAGAVERASQHPLAEAVVRCAESRNLTLPETGDLVSFTGRGVRSSVDGEQVEIGNLRLWEDAEIDVQADIQREMDRLAGEGKSVLAVRHGDRWLGVLGVADQPRPGVQETLEGIRSLGIKTLVMITGDNRGVADAIARRVGIDEVRAELLPEDKVDAVQDLLSRHGSVAMVGDGVNDAPALATATVGIAMGGAGTAAALETADIALMGDDLGGIPFVVGLSRRTRAIIRQNLWLSMAVIAILVLGTTTGVFGIGPAVLVHEGSTLVVVGNALRLLRYAPRVGEDASNS
jgi:Zn2+/Cd2+-exporting ATPase